MSSVNKITNAPTQNEAIEKINEIIDAVDDIIAGGVVVDNKLSTTSTNPVENRVITSELSVKQDVLTAGNNIEITQRASALNWSLATQNTDLGTNNWGSLAYGDGRFLALSQTGYLSFSTNGKYWTLATQANNLKTLNWKKLIYNNGNFYALSSAGTMAISSNLGYSFDIYSTNLSNYGYNDWTMLAYGNNKFVAISGTGYISTSTDGETWTNAVQNNKFTAIQWSDLAYGNNTFVALGYQGEINTSTDGTTWVKHNRITNLGIHSWKALTYDGTKFVAISSTGYVSTSTDGVNWVESVQYTNLSGDSWYSLAYNDIFVALGNNGYISNSMDDTVISATIPSEYVTDTELSTELADYTPTSGLATVATSGDYDDLIDKPNLATVATTGDYDDLTNKPTIPAAQVNSDWNASSGVAQILNKPSLSTVATSGSYNDLSNKPTIPTVNDATLTIQKNGSTVKTFTANASTDVTCNITVPTKTSDITNDSGYITGINSSDVTTALGYTPYDSSNPSGYTTNEGTVTKVNNTSPDSSGNVTLSIPAAQIQSDWTQTTTTAKDYIKNKPNLATVATSGSYNDLTDKPTIPSPVTVDSALSTTSTNPVQNKVINSALGDKLDKSGGTMTGNLTVGSSSIGTNGYIQGTWLQTTAATSLESATDIAVLSNGWIYKQSKDTLLSGIVKSVNNTSPDSNGNVAISIPSAVTESTVSGWGFTKNAGTITGIKMNGASKGTSGVVDLGTVITEHQSLSGYVPTSRTVNGKALTSNISLTASDVGAATAVTITYDI